VNIEVVYALPDAQFCVSLDLDAGAVVEDALNAVASARGFCGVDLSVAPVGIYGRVVEREQTLAEGDRVEIYRPLAVDPRTARRLRAG